MWCSDTCRHRAWEQKRAAESGRSAVEVVERRVIVERATPAAAPTLPKGAEWVPVLTELAHQLDSGRIYDRDLGAIAQAAGAFSEALRRRLQQPHRRH